MSVLLPLTANRAWEWLRGPTIEIDHRSNRCARRGLEHGHSFDTAAKLAGISPRAFYGWRSQADKPDWRPAAALLERRWPDRWSRTERREVSGPGGDAIEIEERRIAETKREIYDLLEAERKRRALVGRD